MNIEVLKTNVKRICSRNDISLKDVAMKMGVAPESLSRTLSKNPTFETLTKLADALGVPISDFFLTHKEYEGYLAINGEVYHFRSIDELKECLERGKEFTIVPYIRNVKTNIQKK